MEQLLKLFSLTPADGVMIPIGTVLFFLLWQLLLRALFAPYLDLLHQRESLTSGALAKAEVQNRKAAELHEEVEQQIREVRLAAVIDKVAILDAARQEAQTLVSSAESEAVAYVKASRRDLKEMVNGSRAKALLGVDGLADQLIVQLRQSKIGITAKSA